jgi:Flp pilus assembly protein TadG
VSLLRRFKEDDRGVAAIEFALILPTLLLLYFGVAELCQATISDRKASHVASAVGDLVAQTTSVTPADLADIFNIGNTMMAPFPTSSLRMRVTSLTANASGTPVVDWSVGYNGYGVMTKGATTSLPMTLSAGDSVIMAQSQFQYTSVVQYLLPNALTYNDTYYLRPRRSTQVTCSAC